MPTYSQLTASERRVVLSNSPHHHPLSTKRESLIGFTLDRSGSMSSLAIVAVQSLNGLIEQQRAITAGDSCFTLALFNHDVRLIHDAVPLFDVPPLLPAQYEPSGGTALNDAIAHLIRSLSGHVHGRNTAVLAAILTDGEENQSRQHSKEDVRQMVTYRRLTHGWQFLFLGPESALSYALSVGIPKVNTAGFETTPEGLRLMLERVSRAISAYRLGDRKFMLALQGGRQNEQ